MNPQNPIRATIARELRTARRIAAQSLPPGQMRNTVTREIASARLANNGIGWPV